MCFPSLFSDRRRSEPHPDFHGGIGRLFVDRVQKLFSGSAPARVPPPKPPMLKIRISSRGLMHKSLLAAHLEELVAAHAVPGAQFAVHHDGETWNWTHGT